MPTTPISAFHSGALPNSRWRLYEIPTDPLWSPHDAGYGYLRPPWNLNPSRYVSRFPLQGGQGLADIDSDSDTGGGSTTTTALLLPDCENGYVKMMQADTPLQFLREVMECLVFILPFTQPSTTLTSNPNPFTTPYLYLPLPTPSNDSSPLPLPLSITITIPLFPSLLMYE